MLTKVSTIVLLLMAFAAGKVTAQQAKAGATPLVKSDTTIKATPSKNNYVAPVFIPGTLCSTPKGAIFCRMEDVLYKRLNIHVKFRMGVDDKYSN